MLRLLKYIKNQKGQTLVEFAIVLPVLLILVMGLIQFGMILSAQIAVTNAAREGARAAVVGAELNDITVNGNLVKGIRRVVEESIGGHIFLKTDALTVTRDVSGDAVIIEVNNAKVSVIAPVPDVLTKGQLFNIHAKASMRLEN